MQLTMLGIFYLCTYVILFGLDETGSLCSGIKDCEICTFEASYPHCNYTNCACVCCKSNEEITQLYKENVSIGDIAFQSNPNSRDRICYNKVCIVNIKDATSQCKKWKCNCTKLNCTDLNDTLTSSENTVENHKTQITFTPSPNYTLNNNITTTTTISSTTINETKDLNRYNTTTLNSSENSAYKNNESQARRNILIGLIVGMVLLFILLLITIIVIWKLRLRAKARELMANKAPQSTTMKQLQKSLTTGIQPLEKYEDSNIYHQLDYTYGDSEQISYNKTMQNLTSATPKAYQDIISGNNAKEGSTYFILEEEVLCGHDISIGDKVAEGSYSVLDNEAKIESSIPNDAALADDSVSRPGGYTRFGDIKRQTTNEYDTFNRVNEENLSIKDNTVDLALEIIPTGAQFDQTTIYDLAKPPILQEAVLNTEEESNHDTDDSICPKLEAEQKNYADSTYFVLEGLKDSTALSSEELQETQTETNYSRLRDVSPVFQHDYNILNPDKDPSDIANSPLADS